MTHHAHPTVWVMTEEFPDAPPEVAVYQTRTDLEAALMPRIDVDFVETFEPFADAGFDDAATYLNTLDATQRAALVEAWLNVWIPEITVTESPISGGALTGEAEATGLAVMGDAGILGIVAARGNVAPEVLAELSSADVADLYDRFVGPAVDNVEAHLLWVCDPD